MNKHTLPLLFLCFAFILSSCSKPVENPPQKISIDLTVVTSFGGTDSLRNSYEAALEAFEEDSGHRIVDKSSTANEGWRASVNADFQAGAEPDVLFYFTGADLDNIRGQIVPIDEIRKVYPNYASNMDEALMPVSTDGKMYGVPTYGNWEGLFVNTSVLNACGVQIPTSSYTWEQFMLDCETIAENNYIPIAASLSEVPHYWLEFSIFNHGSLKTHAQIPLNRNDPLAQNWIDGLNDIKHAYEQGFFAKNTLTAPDAETWQLAYDGKAAFVVDGSWQISNILTYAENPDDWLAVYMPSLNKNRASTDIIAGISMGYMITRKAWDDPEKRSVAVEFIEHMTSSEVILESDPLRITALKDDYPISRQLGPFESSCAEFVANSTGTSFFMTDMLNTGSKAYLVEQVKYVCLGRISAEEVVHETLRLYYSGEEYMPDE